MRKKETINLRSSITLAFLIIALAFPLINCDFLGSNNGSGGDSDDDPEPTTVSTLDDTTVPVEVSNTALTAGEPLVTSRHVQLPPNFQVDLLAGILIDLESSLHNIAITRTDGKTTPNPTVEFTLSVAAGHAPGACAGGTGTQALRFGIIGNEDFSSTDVSEDENTMSQDAADIINTRDFTLCTNVTSSVDANLAVSGINMDFSVAQTCDAEENQDLAGTWTGTFYCEDTCGGSTTTTPTEDIELTVTQADGAAIYVDDGGAIYFGNVCDTSFDHSGVGSSYYEWGTFTITGPNSATKVSNWVAFDDPTCGGTCYDTFTSRSIP